MNLHYYSTGEPCRQVTVEQAVRSMLSEPEGVIEVDGQSCYYGGPREVWAVVSMGGPAWALGLTYDQAVAQFEDTRSDMGIALDADMTGLRCLRITPESAAHVLAGHPDEWLIDMEERIR